MSNDFLDDKDTGKELGDFEFSGGDYKDPFALIDPGTYELKVAETEIKESKNNALLFVITFTVTSLGRKIKKFCKLKEANGELDETGLAIFMSYLRVLLPDLEENINPSVVHKTGLLINKFCIGEIAIDGEWNNIKYIKAPEDQTTALAPF